MESGERQSIRGKAKSAQCYESQLQESRSEKTGSHEDTSKGRLDREPEELAGSR